MDAIVLELYGIEPHEKVSDHAEVRALESKILSSPHKALNQYHGLCHFLIHHDLLEWWSWGESNN